MVKQQKTPSPMYSVLLAAWQRVTLKLHNDDPVALQYQTGTEHVSAPTAK